MLSITNNAIKQSTEEGHDRLASRQGLTEIRILEHKALAAAYSSAEHKEAVSAFLEKRKPKFIPE